MSSRSDTTSVIMRSRIEIARILEDLRRLGAPVTASPGDEEHVFVSRLLAVEPGEGFVLVEYSASKPANAALLAAGSAIFHCNDARTHLQFPALGIHEADHRGAAALRFAFPASLARLQRREHERMRVPEGVSLRCVADSAGVAPFEARVVDFSLGGMGTLVYDSRIRLAPGTHLPRSKIVFHDASAVLVDLEVRYARPIVLEDGSAAMRAGCRFVGSARDLERLAQAFVSAIGSK